MSPQITPPQQAKLHPTILRGTSLALLSLQLTAGFAALHLPAVLLLGRVLAAINLL